MASYCQNTGNPIFDTTVNLFMATCLKAGNTGWVPHSEKEIKAIQKAVIELSTLEPGGFKAGTFSQSPAPE